ncbi:LacI family DNA-binding transcriptional regulator [Bifidobacterium sp. ESL0682]|uniref:LacI family DNA-binding transcriptional regulator n=1 Tax=Bifidobacterium sp. ESL0682 TaxID=2983212 RepID=UPI0023F6805F|nr:LacI family DNA-binding transcriptional regulator [Bifidobacterium sp. ESL0682]WEV42113.1 LacI family DNA-binding transcriptional regulator [Bifidobacterium sp. ESL0682]
MKSRARTSRSDSPNNSITEVAALAEVSTATVSRVLSGRRNKDDDIARRVRDAAEKLHYSANSAASSLRSDITNTLGVVIPSPIDAFSAQLLSKLEPKAREDGKYILASMGETAKEQGECIDSLIARGVDGLIVIPIPGADLSEIIADSATDKIPIVQISGRNTSSKVNWVGIDGVSSMREAITHITDHNGTSIMFMSAGLDNDATADAFVAFQNSSQITGYLHEPEWTTFGECTIQRGYNDTLKAFEDAEDRPNAIICSSDDIAVGSMMALQQLGIAVPNEVKIIGFGDSQLAAAYHPSITTLRPPYESMAEEALRLIKLKRSGRHHLPSHTAFPPQVIRRESTSSPRIGTSDMADPR